MPDRPRKIRDLLPSAMRHGLAQSSYSIEIGITRAKAPHEPAPAPLGNPLAVSDHYDGRNISASISAPLTKDRIVTRCVLDHRSPNTPLVEEKSSGQIRISVLQFCIVVPMAQAAVLSRLATEFRNLEKSHYGRQESANQFRVYDWR